MTKIGIIQPSYIPWRGYFDFIHEVDVFVFLDDVQFTDRSWRSRNRIKVKNGPTVWVSVPTLRQQKQLIKDVRIDKTQAWCRRHLETFRRNYGREVNFEKYFNEIAEIYNKDHDFVSDLNIELTGKIAELLRINTRLLRSSSIPSQGTKDQKLIQIMQHLGACHYVSGPAAQSYLKPELWREAGIKLTFKDYSGYPDYPQISQPFESEVSILDLLFMLGGEAPDYIWGRYRRRV